MMTAPAPVDVDRLLQQQSASQRAFHRALATASPGAEVLEPGPGVQATIVPAAPRLPIVNNVFFDSADTLSRTLPEITRRYRDAGVARWGIWLTGADRELARLLQRAGFRRRLVPMVMGGALPTACRAMGPGPGFTFERAATAEMVGRCIDVAFSIQPPDTLTAALRQDAGTGYRAYVARRGEELACGMLVLHHRGNAYTWGLAATPAGQGTLVAYRLLRTAIVEAVTAGCLTVTCETTPAAEAIARSLRLRPLGRLAFWELSGADATDQPPSNTPRS